MSNDARDIEWTCSCSHVNPDFSTSCNGCGQPRGSEEHESKTSAEYARAVHDLLTQGSTKTRPDTHPLLSPEESEELLLAYLVGVSAHDFAARLERRDVAHFEAVCDPCPDRAWPNAENE